MGPMEAASDGYPSYIPVRLTSPAVGRMEVTSFQLPGLRIEAKVSSPMATAEKLAAVAAPDPPEDPPTVRSRS